MRPSFIGVSPPRPDGWAKASGDARYADDIVLPGMWHGATLRSPHPHARIRSLRWRQERAPAGAVAVTASDLGPLVNGVQLIDDSWPALAADVVRHVGEPVALVAAPTRLEALAALRAFDVEYEPLPVALSIDAPGTEPALCELRLDAGDAEAAIAAAPIVVEGRYRTGHQEHIYIECQAMLAWFEPDGSLEALGSMQCPYYVHNALVHSFSLAPGRVRVRASAVGGGFGGKEDYPSMIAVHAALLARAADRPVKIVYDRHEDIVGTTKRHPSAIRHRTGVDAGGRLLGMDIDITLDGGAYRTLSPVVLSRAILHSAGPYRCDHVRVRGRVVRTNTATNGAFRGFGVPQAAFAIERQMDAIARRVGVDPYEIRARNVLRAGDRLPTGQTLDDMTAAQACLEEVERRTDFRRRWRDQEVRRARGGDEGPLTGVGLSLYFHGAGFTGSGELRMRSPVTVRLRDDGRIEVLTAMTDMGQGCAIVFPQIAVEAAGVTPDDVVFAPPDTDVVPDSGPTVASRTTMIVGGTIARAVAEVRTRLLAWAATRHGGPLEVRDGRVWQGAVDLGPFARFARDLVAEQGPLEVTLRHEPPAWQTFDDLRYQGAAYPTYGWAADVVAVDVDPDTLAVRAREAAVVCDVGRAIHPTLCRGQVEGGTLQAVAYGAMEEMKVADGRYLNDRLATYIIPTIKDAPRMDVHLLEFPYADGPFGAKGIGELPMDGGAPAVVQAIENATGVPVAEIPATAERILGATLGTER
jgi:CO/xanthine dehydrogenase Mo-binding subunit